MHGSEHIKIISCIFWKANHPSSDAAYGFFSSSFKEMGTLLGLVNRGYAENYLDLTEGNNELVKRIQRKAS